MKKTSLPTVAGVLTAVVASLCCIGPVVVALIGVGSIGAFSVIESYRPYLIGLTVAILGLAFYLTYRKRMVACEDGSCKIESGGKWNKIAVWAATFLAAIAIAFPYLGITPSSSANASVIPQATAVLDVEGMDCAACAKGVEGMLTSLKGVHKASVVFETGEATIQYDPQLVQPTVFVERINETSYSAKLIRDEQAVVSTSASGDQCCQLPEGKKIAKLSEQENAVRRFIYTFIIDNKRAPATEEIQQALKLTSLSETEAVISKLAKYGLVELEGNMIIAAFPFSPKVSQTKVIFANGHWAYSMCAIDALGISKMMNEDVTIEAVTPLDKKPVHIVFKKEKMESIIPSSALVWVSENEGSVAKNKCSQINFFASSEELERWKKLNSSQRGYSVDIQEAIAFGQSIFGNMMENL
jgi:copper chaperone CopZ